jgi:hypothetical protein
VLSNIIEFITAGVSNPFQKVIKKEASQKQRLRLAGEIVFNYLEVCGCAIPLQGKSPITKDVLSL